MRRWWRGKKEFEAEMGEELRDHLERQVAANVAAGMTREEAERQARLQLGAIEGVKEGCREERRGFWLETLWADARYGARVLRKSPAFTTAAVLTLALGIGANTAIFSFIDAVLLRSLPVKNPEQLVVFRWSARKQPKLHGHSDYGDCANEASIGDCSFSVPFFRTVRGQAKLFSGMAVFAGPLDVDFSGNGAANVAHGTYVSGDFFSTLGVDTIFGRSLTLSDDTPSAPPAIVLSYGYWVRAFGADRSAVGRAVRLDNTSATIVGVADPHFTNLTPGKIQDFFMPLSLADRVRGEWWGDQDRLSDSSQWWVVMLGRIQPGISIKRAQAAASTLFRNEVLHGATPFFKSDDAPTITLRRAQAGLNSESSRLAPALYLSLGIVGFILLIACANVAGLTLARSATRQKEITVRLALGAGRVRIVRQLLSESLLLSMVGGLLGAAVALWRIGGIVGLISSDSGQPFPFVVAPDWRVLSFAMGVTVATGIVFGLTPALRGSRVDLTPSLKESASSLPGAAARSGRRLRLSDALVIVQVALSMVVLTGAGLLVRTLRNLHNINPGFDARNVLLFGVDPTLAGYTDAQTTELYGNLQQRLAAIPSVVSVSYSEDPLLSGGWSADDFHIDGAPPKEDVNTAELAVGLNFFSTMRIPVLAGRTFTSQDFAAAANTRAAQVARAAAAANRNAPRSRSTSPSSIALDQAYFHAPSVPVIVNATFARKFLSNRNPLGVHMGDPQTTDDAVQNPGPGYTIVGIAGDTKYAYPRRNVLPMMFLPLVGNVAHFELRTGANPTALAKTVREVVSQIAGNLPVTDVLTQTEQIDRMLSQERLMSRLSTFYAALALVLACIGLYGLLSYEVARRTREIGIRTALGAQHRDLLRLVVGQGILLALVGVAIGIISAIGVTRFMATMLYGVRPNDPATIAGVAVLLITTALLACYIPARRAMKVDPMVALRYE